MRNYVIIALLLFVSHFSFSQTQVSILSWNIRDLGRTKDASEILQIAEILKAHDIIAIQEVVAKDPAGAQAVARIADELNRMGSKWDYSISVPTNSPSAYMSERYAFLWKTSKIGILNIPFLDTDLENKIIREPYIGKFQLIKDDSSFYLVNFHSRKHNDNPEEEIILFKDYPKRLKSERIIIAGDFNLDENHIVWNNFYNMGFKSAIKNSPTTLKMKCKNGKYLNHSIDNIYYLTNEISLVKSGCIDFVYNCNNLDKARLISDHLPVFIECKFN